MNHRTTEEGVGISLTPQYYFHPLHRHLDTSLANIAESSPLHLSTDSNWELLVSEDKLLTTKLHALIIKQKNVDYYEKCEKYLLCLNAYLIFLLMFIYANYARFLLT